MNMTVYEKINIALNGWVITNIGMVDRYRYLVIAQWDNDDEKTPYVNKQDGKKYDHPTRMLSIDVKNNKLDWLTSYDGYSHGYCDGGYVEGNMEAFFISYNGITYHLDYGADTFRHEELLLTRERREKGIARGADALRLIGNHFYVGDSGNEIHRRDAPKKWTMISKDPVEYCRLFGGEGYGCDIRSIDGFGEDEIYFGGYDGNLWVYKEGEWEKIVTNPKWQISSVICADDGRVYAVDTRGGVAVGRGAEFKAVSHPDMEAIPYLYEACCFKGELYAGGVGGPLYRFDSEKGWIEAGLPLIGSVESLCAKDGIMAVAGSRTIKLYNGKETLELYGGDKELGRVLLKGFMESAAKVVESLQGLSKGVRQRP